MTGATTRAPLGGPLTPDAHPPNEYDPSKIPVAPPLEKLGWTPARMVRWLDPRQLAATAVRSILADAFGEYADKREMQAALHPDRAAYDYTHAARPDLDDGVWIDYVADLGDGFDSTYAVAYALSRGFLERKGATLGDSGPTPGREREAAGHPNRLRRGNILIMGGDQVYPTPSRELYEERLVGPYRAALPWDDAEHPDRPDRPADLFAVPGNHDWYDGLTTFLRLFCTRPDWVGGWRVPQRRSYFALRLPHNWWVLGVDIALTARIDEPQLEYFDAAAQLAPGDKVILVTAQPSWVEYGRGHEMGYENLVHFEERCVRKHGATVALTLTGDLHHYVRYSRRPAGATAPTDPGVDPASDPPPDDARHKIISGGGGAYLYPTHHLDPAIRLPDPSAAAKESCYDLAASNVFPSQRDSWRLGLRAPLFVPLLNVWFVLFLGCVYGLFIWVLQASASANRLQLPGQQANEVPARLVERLAQLDASNWTQALGLCASVLARSPASLFIAALVVLGCVAFASPAKVSRNPRRQRVRRALGAAIGAAHGLAHLTLATLGLWVVVRTVALNAGRDYAGLWNALFGGAELLGFGLAGAVVMGVYLAVTSVLPFVSLHWNESFSAQAIKDYKNFVRLHLDRDGALHVYGVGMDTVPRRRKDEWEYHEGATGGAPWWTPAKPLGLRLIDRLTIAPPARRATTD